MGSLPTFIAVILAWVQSNAKISDTNARFDKRVDDFAKRMDDVRSLPGRKGKPPGLSFAPSCVEDVIDARLKHLEENP